ncbi:MAG: quinolinate synthase NadA [Acidimicrobiales bacterium]|nr:quinolinate synthase NadA [Acidimicrobiales bacterium]
MAAHQGFGHDPTGDVTPRSKRRPTVAHTEATVAVAADPEISQMSEAELIEGVNRLRVERDAIILAHNYQLPVIQDLADFVGDSLQLSQQAAQTDKPLIVFCGVHFMAETAAILSPDKTVLIPDLEAGCSLAASVTAEEVRQWRAEHPDGVVVSYVNTDADVKAESDYCCTSSNAIEVVQSVPADKEILFLPDMFLGLWAERVSGRKLNLWLGECHVHAGFRPEDVIRMLDEFPDADLLLHPECGCVSQCMYHIAEGDIPADRSHVLSTGGMVRYARETEAPVAIVGTETGMLHRLRKENQRTRFIPLREDAVCEYMKAITLPKLYRALRDGVYEVRVPEDTAARARAAIDRMLATVPG